MNAVAALDRGLILVKPGALDRLTLRALVRSAGGIARPRLSEDFNELCDWAATDEPLRLILIATDLSLGERRHLADLVAARRDRPALLRYGQFSLGEIVADLRLGYRGHLARSVELDQLLPALQFALAGHRFVSPELLLASPPADAGRGIANLSMPLADGVELTPRHRDVLVELAQGATNQQIGERLGITEATAKVHVHRILRLLGAKNRTEAARKAREMGLLSF